MAEASEVVKKTVSTIAEKQYLPWLRQQMPKKKGVSTIAETAGALKTNMEYTQIPPPRMPKQAHNMHY